jgi:hypothetical protein
MELIRARLKVAEALAKELRNEHSIVEGMEVEIGSGNVFADLGLPGQEATSDLAPIDLGARYTALRGGRHGITVHQP